MATTTNFGWETPDDTDLVKDGAAAIRTALGGVDTSFVDLKGGTTGQVLAKASATDLDFSWVAVDPLTILDAKGDLITATAADTPARLAVGATNGMTLQVDSTTATGLKWATPATASSGLTLIKRASFSNVADTGTTFDAVFTSTYRSFMVVMETTYAGTEADDLLMLYRYSATSQATTYFSSCIQLPATGTTINTTVNNGANAILSYNAGGVNYPTGATMYFNNIGNGSSKPTMFGTGYNGAGTPSLFTFGALNDTSRSYDGFLIKSSSTNVTGTISVYGLATA